MPRVLIVFALGLAVRGPAYADDSRDKALKLFEDSDKAYKAGKFENAAELLREAYGLYPEPILLYNLGRAQEGLGDMQGAIESYERYLRDAKQISDRGAIERRIETLRAQIAKQEEDAKRLAEEEERRRREEEERKRRPPPVIDDRTAVQKYGPWITVGTGGALAGTGVVFGLLATAKNDDAIAAPVQIDAADLHASARKHATIANVLFAVGGAAVLGGAVWQYFEYRRSKTTTAQLRVSPTSVAIEWVLP